MRIQIKILDQEMKYSVASYKNINEQLVKQSGSQAEAYSKHSDLSLSLLIYSSVGK